LPGNQSVFAEAEDAPDWLEADGARGLDDVYGELCQGGPKTTRLDDIIEDGAVTEAGGCFGDDGAPVSLDGLLLLLRPYICPPQRCEAGSPQAGQLNGSSSPPEEATGFSQEDFMPSPIRLRSRSSMVCLEYVPFVPYEWHVMPLK
jgi:hypothetical protein